MTDTYRPDPFGSYGDKRDDRYDDRYDDSYDGRYDNRYDDRNNDVPCDRYDTYRPRSYSRSPLRHQPELPARNPQTRRLRGGDGIYRFGENNRHAQDAISFNGYSNPSEFKFRSDRQVDFGNGNFNHQAPRGPRGARYSNRGQGRRERQNGHPPRRFGPKPANAREILHTDVERGGTPERLMGMVGGQSKFKDIEYIDYDERDDHSNPDVAADSSEDSPSRKRAKMSDSDEITENRPKWSNPDPYTVLPPVADTTMKKKDVLHLIRKAKVERENTGNQTSNAVSRNVDFISFADDEDGNNDTASNIPQEDTLSVRIGSNDQDEKNADAHMPSSVNDVSTSFKPLRIPPPETFSHLKRLHPDVGPVFQDLDEEATDNREETYNAVAAANAHIVTTDDLRRHKRERPVSKKRGRDGEIQPDWTASSRSSSMPWYIDHSATPRMSFWLHKEICDFYNFIKPRQFEQKIRQDLIQRIEKALHRNPYFRNCQLQAFGSYGQGIYLPTSDMDLVLLSPMYQQQGIIGYGKNSLHKIAHSLYTYNIATPDTANIIKFAKVPIIKFVDRETGLHVDISLDNVGGLQALATFDEWRRQWPWLPVLLGVLKQFLLMRGINEVFNGGLGGFSITCMLVSMLQMTPKLQTGNFDAGGTLGETLLEFFDLYGNKFNMRTTGIRLNPPRYFSKATCGFKVKADRWTIVDPNKSDNDLSGGSSEAPLISQTFSEAHRTLVDAMSNLNTAPRMLRQGQSFLSSIIGGDYEQMMTQRRNLRENYVKRFGRIPVEDD